ncbi:MAG: transcriptional regulator [Spirochaetales bacterium]|nr:transcriptional regulator [Spirochaetales bacterium]
MKNDEVIPFRNDSAFHDLSLVLAACNDPQLVQSFLASLFTAREVRDIAARWELVHRLALGETQRQIAQELGMSLCKITRGSKELKKTDSPFKKMLILRQSLNPPR